MNIKKMLLATAVSLAAVCSEAAYLDWMVDASDASDFDFNLATLHVVNGDSDTTLSTMVLDENGNWSDSGQEYMGKGVETFSALTGEMASSPTAYSFYIELINYSEGNYNFVARSYPDATYQSLSQHIYTGDGLTPTTPVTAWHGGGYAIPEPTGAALFLIGIAIAGLKRRAFEFKET